MTSGKKRTRFKRSKPDSNLGSASRLYPKQLYGRDADYAVILKIIKQRTEGPLWICIYGFAGVGKTSLLGHLREKLEAEGLRAIGKNVLSVPYHTLGYYESLAGLLRRITAATSKAPLVDENRYTVIQEFIEQHCDNNTFLLIDEFRGDDESLINDFEWLLSNLEAAQLRVFIITTSRATPRVIAKSTLPLQPVRLDPLTLEAVREFVNKRWPGEIFSERVEDIFQATRGNPKLIELICGNPDTWARFEPRAPLNFDVVEEVYRDIHNQEWKKDLESLSVLASVTPEWDDYAGQAIVPGWFRAKPELAGRCLIDEYGEGTYRVHDLLANVLYQRLNEATRAAIHNIAGQYYASLNTDQSL